MQNLQSLSDKELYKLCQTYGANIRMLTKKFAALLPEVERRQLYKKYGFHSIFEFAGRIGGMRRETVVDILRVSQKLEDKPLLQAQMENVGWTKLRAVSGIATKENEKMLAEKVREMSQDTLLTFVQEMKKQNGEPVQNRIDTGSEESISRRIHLRLLLDSKTDLRFRELQKKFSKGTGTLVDFNEVMKTLLDYYDEGHGAKKEKMPIEALEEEACEKAETVTGSRYIPAKIKKFLHEKYQGRCAFHGCLKLPEIFHHTRRFSLNPSHDPDFVVPLCKEHERLAHLGLIENEEKPPEEWRIRLEPDKNLPKYEIDKMVNQYRITPIHIMSD